MPRAPHLQQKELLAKISQVFRKVGYEGASLAMLAEETGLQKASLYHRFPGGKMEMATQILSEAEAWLKKNIVAPMNDDTPPEDRVVILVKQLDKFYSTGKQACLLNTMAFGHPDGPLATAIQGIFTVWLTALTKICRDAGFDAKNAQQRAEEAVILVEGSLVLSRGLKSTQPFKYCLSRLPYVLLDKTSK